MAVACHPSQFPCRFGQVMLDNLSQRGCALPGAFPACKNKESQVSRLTAPPVGWDNAICWSMNEVYQSLLHSGLDSKAFLLCLLF